MAGVGPMTLLAAVGPQDAFFRKAPFASCTWLRYTRFATSTAQLDFPAGLDFGSSGRIVVPKSVGDILTDMCLEITLPAVGVGWKWVEDVGYKLITSFKLTLGNTVVVESDGLMHQVLNELNATSEQRKCLRHMTGHACLDADVEQQLIIPLRLLCSSIERCRLPLIAMTMSKAQVDVTLESAANLLFVHSLTVDNLSVLGGLDMEHVNVDNMHYDVTDVYLKSLAVNTLQVKGDLTIGHINADVVTYKVLNAGYDEREYRAPHYQRKHRRHRYRPDAVLFDLLKPTIGSLQSRLMVDVAFLETSEKFSFLHHPYTLAAEMILHQDFPVSHTTNNHDTVMLQQTTFDLSFMQGAVKQVVLVFLDTDDTILHNAVSSCSLFVNNVQQFRPRPGSYFRDPSAYRACNACPHSSIYTINFAVCCTAALQPNGCLDMSQITTCTLSVALNALDPTSRLRVYSVAYQPLLFSGNNVTVA